ncbi:MAG: LysM peptidoglycan-binding domain-containing protein [Polyangiaceae bacterium]|nr:LysM peptidoglycan-binding domain-containing protein [Polyangiaceae bacterium]MCE7888136.1 LysM peptidoglycan-binding domain-containing protein [Sorangiineae bacterium PRO1]MCL4750947.1 LysM peptidoglycan-binding domain-containing protein [Myxococcales bacterium]
MRRLVLALACLVVALTLVGPARATQTHVVGPGHTLGKIAKRYHVTVEAICDANGIERRAPLKIGTKLVIPDAADGGKPGKPAKAEQDEAEEPESAEEAEEPKAPKPEQSDDKADKSGGEGKGSRNFGNDGLRVLDVPGHGEAYYFEPIGPGRKGMKPVVMYLHGRGGSPLRDCRRWAPVARRFGWLVCPSGPSAYGDGRDWSNNWYSGQRVAIATLNALRKEYGRRVQLVGNTLMGFSEGAYVALNVGVREPRTFNRWLILAGNTSYWGGAGLEELKKNATTLKRVYLITGEADSVIDGTHQLQDWLERHKVATRVSTPKDMGHEVALERKAAMYRAALHWLDRGGGAKAGTKKASASNKKESARKR